MPQMTHAQKDEVLASLREDNAALQAQIEGLEAANKTLEGEKSDLEIKLKQQIRKTNRAKSGSAVAPSHRSSNIRFSEPKSCHKPDCDFTFFTPDEGRAHAMAGVHGSVVDA